MHLTLPNNQIIFKMLITKYILWAPRHFLWDSKPIASCKYTHWAVSPAGETQGVQLTRRLLSIKNGVYGAVNTDRMKFQYTNERSYAYKHDALYAIRHFSFFIYRQIFYHLNQRI